MSSNEPGPCPCCGLSDTSTEYDDEWGMISRCNSCGLRSPETYWPIAHRQRRDQWETDYHKAEAERDALREAIERAVTRPDYSNPEAIVRKLRRTLTATTPPEGQEGGGE